MCFDDWLDNSYAAYWEQAAEAYQDLLRTNHPSDICNVVLGYCSVVVVDFLFQPALPSEQTLCFF